MIIIGDTHGLKPVFELIDENKWVDQNLIHVGDFNLGFKEIRQDVENLLLLDEALLDTNNKLYVIRGNHDNPIFWNKDVGLYLPKFHSLNLVDDYSLLTIEKKQVLFVGGAISIDRIPRSSHNPPSWWQAEGFKYNGANIRYIKKLDIVITHNAPSFAYPNISVESDLVNHYHKLEAQHGSNLKNDLEEERADITELYDDLTKGLKLKPKYWCYGHFHMSHEEDIDGTIFKLLKINETYEIK